MKYTYLLQSSLKAKKNVAKPGKEPRPSVHAQSVETNIIFPVCLAVMSVTGIFGNLSVCCVILRIPGMRSATNYYLFSLAVADLLILLLGK